jgi:peptide/nickel transport system substrate-binding protein
VKSYQRVAALAVPVLAVAIVASACGSSSSGGNNNSGAKTNENGVVSGLKAQDINPQPVSALKQGGTVVWSLDQFSTQWNYSEIDGPESSTLSVLGALMPIPMISDTEANVTPDPDYIKSISASATLPLTVTAILNPDAKWSDGTPITEADYAANLLACTGKIKANQCATNTGYNDIKSVSQGANGKFSVVVVFSKPFIDWKGLFSNPLYPARYQVAKQFETGYLNKIPVTAGPFANPVFNKSAQTITVTPSTMWWGQKPLLSKIVFKALTSDAANLAFVNGEIDYNYDFAVDTADYKQNLKATNGHVTLAAGPDYRQFTVSSVHGFMKDEKVRQAVAMGTNRDAIIKSDLEGIPWPIVPLNNHWFMNTQVGYENTAGVYGEYNPTAAETLLTSDGFVKKDGYYTKGGVPIKLNFMIPDGIASSKNEGELFQAMMQQIGIKVHINSVPSNDWADKWLVPGNFDLAPFSWLGTPFAISGGAPIYLSPKNGGGENFTGTANPPADKLINQALIATDQKQAIALTNQADKLLYQSVHTITLFQRPQASGVTNGLANIGSFGFATPNYLTIGWMKNPAATASPTSSSS